MLQDLFTDEERKIIVYDCISLEELARYDGKNNIPEELNTAKLDAVEIINDTVLAYIAL